jgi:hypothetical protein
MSDIRLNFSMWDLLALGAISTLGLVWLALLFTILRMSFSSRPVETKRTWQWTGGVFLLVMPLVALGCWLGTQ